MVVFPPPPVLPAEQRMSPEDAHAIRREVQHLLQIEHRGFPGSQPVSFDRNSMRALLEHDYYVCEKSDGLRGLLYLTEEEGVETAYMWDRRDDFYQIRGHHFPRPDNHEAFWTNTVLDGELVNDVEADGRTVQRFLAFDCLVLDRKLLIERSLDKRLAYLKDNIFNPYKKLFEKYPEELEYQPFLFQMKDMQLGYAMEMLFRDVLPKLKHGNDGLIFTCRETPYVLGTDRHIIKWKPPHENTIDFKLMLDIPLYEPEDGDGPFPDYDVMPKISLHVRGNKNADVYQGELFLTEEEWNNLKALEEPLDERIVECYKDEQQRWRYMRFRDDKVNANHISVFESVLDSIRDAISERDLINVAPDVKKHWKARAAQAQQQQRSQ